MNFGWSIFLILIFGNFVGGDGPCEKKEGLCGCVSTNKKGETIKIDMSKLDKTGGSYFSDITGDEGWSFSINLCTGFTITDEDGCIDVTGCRKSPPIGGHGATPLGKPGSQTFGSYVSGQALQVKYEAQDKDRVSHTMLLKLNCNKTVEGTAKFVSKDDTQFVFNINSEYVCPEVISSGSSGLSTGSVLVIIFFVILIVYFISGSLFMKYKRGATGKELLPNVNFWTSLPGLIKDGCIFFGTKIRQLCQRDGYSDI